MTSKPITEDRLRNTRAWAEARVGQLSGADVIVGAIDELLLAREQFRIGLLASSPCPGCMYREGKFIKPCALHAEIDRLARVATEALDGRAADEASAPPWRWLYRNALGNLVAAVSRFNLQDADVKFAMREACQLLGPPYTAEGASGEATPPPPPDATPRMRIEYQRLGRCLWHADCPNNSFGSGIMREVTREDERSLLECLHCGQRAYFPKGAVSACVDVLPAAEAKACPKGPNGEHNFMPATDPTTNSMKMIGVFCLYCGLPESRAAVETTAQRCIDCGHQKDEHDDPAEFNPGQGGEWVCASTITKKGA